MSRTRPTQPKGVDQTVPRDPLALREREIVERWRNQPRESYLLILSVMKGATLANAALVVTQSGMQDWQRWPLWIVSFVALLLSYTSASVGLLMTGYGWRLPDVALPFALGVLEFCMFSALLFQANESPRPTGLWYAVLAAWAVTASAVASNARRGLEAGRQSDSPLDTILRKSASRAGRDTGAARRFAVLAAALAATSFVWHDALGDLETILTGLFLGFLLLLALRQQQEHRDWLGAELRKLDVPSVESDPVSDAMDRRSGQDARRLGS